MILFLRIFLFNLFFSILSANAYAGILAVARLIGEEAPSLIGFRNQLRIF